MQGDRPQERPSIPVPQRAPERHKPASSRLGGVLVGAALGLFAFVAGEALANALADDTAAPTPTNTDGRRAQNGQERAGGVGDKPAAASPAPSFHDDGEPAEPGEECVICLVSARSFAMVPCGHLAACGPCAREVHSGRVAQCPVCRAHLTGDRVMRVFR